LGITAPATAAGPAPMQSGPIAPDPELDRSAEQNTTLATGAALGAAGIGVPAAIGSGIKAGLSGAATKGAQVLDVAKQGVSALQQQAQKGAANLKMPGQFGQASQLARAAGAGSMMAGQNYANRATDPNAVGAYMNPYLQQSLAPQLSLLNQQQALQAQDINARASGQGAFGGNRATLAQGLNAQNFDLARQQAIGQGYNTAFNQAQQAQQFGANLGVQGLQAGMQGAGVGLQGVGTQLAGTGQGMQGAQVGLQGVSGAQAGYTGATNAANALTNIGTAQNNAAMGITGLQNQLGTQQYNLPYQQLQFGQGMLSGLPVSQQNTTGQQIGYQAPPNIASQTAGLGTAALGTLGLLNQTGALSGIKSMFNTPGGGNNYTPPDASYSAPSNYMIPSIANYEPEMASGGIIRSYAKGGLVKSGSDLADIRLYALLG
jgi:hypothetical protein